MKREGLVPRARRADEVPFVIGQVNRVVDHPAERVDCECRGALWPGEERGGEIKALRVAPADLLDGAEGECVGRVGVRGGGAGHV